MSLIPPSRSTNDRTPGPRSGVFGVYLLYALSGFVSLGYQVAWFRILADRFGSTNLTFALVVANFIGGLGVGALVSRGLCRRLARATGIHDRLRLYGLVELLVTLTVGLTFLAGLVPADLWGHFPYRLADGLWRPNMVYESSQLVIAMACVFVPSVFMGVTFPLLCDACRTVDGPPRFPSALYAFNTLGACSGVLTCLFVFLPWVGHERMLWVLLGMNLVIAVVFLARRTGPVTRRDQFQAVRQTAGTAPPRATALLIMTAVLSGLVAGALEGDMFKRIDFMSSGDSAVMALIAFWAILAIFLASWAVRVITRLDLGLIKVAWVLGFIAYASAWQFEGAIQHVFRVLESGGGPVEPQAMQLEFYGGFLGGLLNTMVFVGIFVFPAYFCVSLLLPWVCNRMQGLDRHLGLAYGLNTLAFCAGLISFTLIAPRVSVFYSMKLIMVLFAVATVLLLTLSETRPVALWKPAVAAAALAIGCLVTPRGFDRSYVIPDGIAATSPVRALKSNGAHTTYVVEAREGKYLFFDRHPMSGTRMPHGTYMLLMAHMPLLAHPDPKRALLICYGVGMTASAIAAHGSIEAIDVVELNPRVIETAPEFADDTGSVHLDRRIRFIIDDGRSFLRLSDNTYDLITSEPPPPMQVGTYRLYTREYYRQVLAHLGSDGLMTQWIPTYQMPAEAAELAIRTFIDVFPHALLFTGGEREFILLGSPAPIDLPTIERRFHEQPEVNIDLRRMGVRSPLSLFARIIHGDAALRRRFGEGSVIRDTHNDLEFLFRTPTQKEVITYAPLEILAEIDTDRLACGNELRRVLTHLGRLRYHVAGFPIATLGTARETASAGVRLADVDWALVTEHLEQFDAHRAARMPQRAEAALIAALKLAPEQPLVLYRLASLQLARGRVGAAEQTLRRFLQIEPGESIGHLMLGGVLARQGRTDDALAAMNRAVETDPHSPDAHRALGRMLLANGRRAQGITHLREAVLLAPGSRDFQRALDVALEQPRQNP